MNTIHEYAQTVDAHNGYLSDVKFPQGTAKSITIAVAGYKYDVYTFEGYIMGAVPKAKNASRGVTMRTGVNAKYKTRYAVFSNKLADSVSVLIMALETAKDDLSALLSAIGGATDHCACCGAELTDALSVARGIGPECYKKIWVSRADVREVMERRLAKA
jgi:hypothetical protein